MKNKEEALLDFMNIIKQAWTYDRMTEAEGSRCMDALREARISGTYSQRHEQLNSVYRAFLLGLDYKAIGWRDPDYDGPLF